MNPLILLVSPLVTKKVNRIRRSIFAWPPIGLAYLGSGLEQAGFKVEILDANVESLSHQETAERIIRSPAKYIGLAAVTNAIPLVFQISSLVKSKNKGKFIFAGGPHVSFMPEQTLKDCRAIDAVVRGEGEITTCELIEKLEEGKDLFGVKGVTFRKNDEIINNPDRELIEDIDTIPFPARHLLPLHLYSPPLLGNLNFRGSRCAAVITARGCPNKCVFCSSSAFWKRVRVRKPENVIQELEFLVKQYGVRYVDFLDDTMNLSAERMEKICHLMVEKKLNIEWSCYARVDNITPELANLMKKAGCRFVQFGIESGNQEVLNRIKKGTTLEQVREAVKITKKAGLRLRCFFMIGLPGDTRETVNQTIDFARELNPDIALFTIPIPFPGTALYEEYRKEGLIEDGYIWDDRYGVKEYNTATLTGRELKDLLFKAYRRFYRRPAFFWQTLLHILRHPLWIKTFLFLR